MKRPTEEHFLPDVTSEKRNLQGSGVLDWVGMDGIEIPIALNENGQAFLLPARASVYVDLRDPQVKGIHMSRLYLVMQEELASRELSPESLRKTLQACLQSHEHLSTRCRIRLDFTLMFARSSLKSELLGWRSYPVAIEGILSKEAIELRAAFRATYSSTCPCSAALARQLVSERFREDFKARQTPHGDVPLDAVASWLAQESVATPHSQRSQADVSVQFSPHVSAFEIGKLIEVTEAALQTSVQAVVKREDEQVFSKLNAENLLFCEDAARRIQQALSQNPDQIRKFWVRARHMESLHAHDAVSVATGPEPAGTNAANESDSHLEIPFD